MRTLLAATAALAACAFEPGQVPDGPLGGGGGGGVGGGGGIAPDGGVPTSVTMPCEVSDPALRLCIELEDETFESKVLDSSPSRLDGLARDIAPYARRGERAALFGFVSRVEVPEAPALDLTSSLTIEMWVFPAFNHSANLLTNTDQYQLQLNGDGRIRCVVGNSAVTSSDELEPGEWAHVACVHDDAANRLRLYIDGDLSGDAPGVPASGAGTNGTRIGGGLAGGIDDIRIYARALTAVELCRNAGC